MSQFAGKPPSSLDIVISTPQLAILLKNTILGTEYKTTGKPRTDGSWFRKKITDALDLQPGGMVRGDKGMPKLINQLIDVQLITKGDKRSSFNFQVWNRLPNSKKLLCLSQKGEPIYGNDIRYVFGFHEDQSSIISTIGIFTGHEIETYLRKKPFSSSKTIKEQMILSEPFKLETRQRFLEKSMVIGSDNLMIPEIPLAEKIQRIRDNQICFQDPPSEGYSELLSLQELSEVILSNVGSFVRENQGTRLDGQQLERSILESLGYCFTSLEAQFPDIRNQLLEIKIQDSQTVDLGRYTPVNIETIKDLGPNITTEDIRYFILLVEKDSGIPYGAALLSGKDLIQRLDISFIPEKSYKNQNNLDLCLFKRNKGKLIYVHNGQLTYL